MGISLCARPGRPYTPTTNEKRSRRLPDIKYERTKRRRGRTQDEERSETKLRVAARRLRSPGSVELTIPLRLSRSRDPDDHHGDENSVASFVAGVTSRYITQRALPHYECAARFVRTHSYVGTYNRVGDKKKKKTRRTFLTRATNTPER